MVERIQMGFDVAMIFVVVLSGMAALALGSVASWFIFQPFKWLEAGLKRAVRHD